MHAYRHVRGATLKIRVLTATLYAAEASSCPVPESVRGYGGKLDPRNNMPVEPNQMPAPGQLKALSTSRLQSNIPKGGTDSTWVYPSPQMFFNGTA